MFILKCSLTELRGFWDTLAPGFQWERSVAEIRVGGSALRRAMKKRSDFVIRSLKRVVNWTITMGYSEEPWKAGKGFLNINVTEA